KVIFSYLSANELNRNLTAGAKICCQPLLVTPTNNINLSNGIMSFIYNSNNCRTLAIATCSQKNLLSKYGLKFNQPHI
ncbi:unnamed protein product, partial [Onchocerca flexuosa]|uniref:Uncharacterized protein n=1 Tax=Onchocerca flexuosa TaxID=387005 RepID=A0A183HR37_9BILA